MKNIRGGFVVILFCFCFFPVGVRAKVLDVPFLSQVPPGSWSDTRNCGQTSFLMIDAYFNNKNIDETSIKNIDDWIEKNIGDSKRNYSGSYTTVDKIKNIAVDYGSFDPESIVIERRNKNIDFLKQEVEASRPVIVAVYTNMLLKGIERDVLHFMVLVGIDETHVYVNDPGKSKGEKNKYTIEQFLKAWEGNNYAAMLFQPHLDQDVSAVIETEDASYSFFQKIKNTTFSWFKKDEVEADFEEEFILPEINEEEVLPKEGEEIPQPLPLKPSVYDLVFLPYKKEYKINLNNKKITLEIQVKNTGDTTWKKADTSLNVVSGITKNNIYYHPSWVTKLRPAQLSQKTVQPGKVGHFTVQIATPEKPGDYLFQLQGVRQVGNSFVQIGQSFYAIKIQVAEVTQEILEKKDETKEGKNPLTIIDKTVDFFEEVEDVVQQVTDTVVEEVVNISHQTRRFFGHGGGGSSVSTEEPPTGGTDSSPEPESPEALQSMTVLSPSSSPWLTTVSSTKLYGEKSDDGVIIFINGDNSEVVYASSTAWSQQVTLSEGGNQFIIHGETAEGEQIGSTTTKSIFLDSIAPSIGDVQMLLSQTVTGTVDISWVAEDSGVGIEAYDVEYKPSETGDIWQPIASSTTSTVHALEAARLEEIFLRVRAVDFAGNISEWKAAYFKVDWSKTVVINEIAWMGTRAGAASDEWIELYNTTDTDIDLTDWSLSISGEEINWQHVSSTIPAQGYYLLERTDDKSVQGVAADGIYTGGMKNTGEDLLLMDPDGNRIDQVDNSEGWVAGEAYKSMERRSSEFPGSEVDNWKTSDSVSPQGRPDGGGYIFGSPKFANRGYWYLVDLEQNYFAEGEDVLTLTQLNSPYIIDYKTHIPQGKTLIVEEGVVFAGIAAEAYIDVEGTLLVQGREDEPVVFTSALDSDYLKINPTALTGTPTPGDWSHIIVKENATASFTHTKFLYGGFPHTHTTGWVYGQTEQSQAIANTGGELTLDYVSMNSFYTHERDLFYHSLIWQDGAATTTIRNSEFYGGYMGIKNKSADGNIFIYDSLWSDFSHPDGPIVSVKNIPKCSRNILQNNAFDGISLEAVTIENEVVLSSEHPYLLGNMTVMPEGSLGLPPGTSLFLRPRADVVIHGELRSLGTAEAPVTWQPQIIDMYWGSLVLDNAIARIVHTTFTQGNNSLIDSQHTGMITADNSTIHMDYVTLVDARRPYNMFYAKQSDIFLANSSIGWSTPKTVSSWNIDGIKMMGGVLNIENTFFYEMDRGIEGYQEATGTMTNMDNTHFFSTGLSWWPEQLFDTEKK
jgi:uncharacterized protein YvpB